MSYAEGYMRSPDRKQQQQAAGINICQKKKVNHSVAGIETLNTSFPWNGGEENWARKRVKITVTLILWSEIQTSKEHLCFYLLHDFLSAQKLII